MSLSPVARKLALVTHITASVGWVGADAAFLALAIRGLSTTDVQTARASYMAMATIAWAVIIPLSFASLLTGLIQALCTKWGLFRHYWVVIKFLIAVVAVAVLMVHTRPIDLVSHAAASNFTAGDFHSSRIQLVVAAGAGLAVLLVALALGVFKPRGMTSYGWRKHRQHYVDEQAITSK
ncbi:MAG: hypothetical protein ABR582_11680 [Gemmatimonadaceae bacterium]